jgi:hypothetical protein
MNRAVIFTFLLGALPAYAADDQSSSRRLLHIGQPVFSVLNGDKNWNGYVLVSASPCPEQPTISTQFEFINVSNKEDVLEKIAPRLDATEKTAEELEKLCKK